MTEHALEERFAVPCAVRLVGAQAEVLLFTHPWRNKRRCGDGCAETPPGGAGRVHGCPNCWRESKTWATVEAFGTRHTFDMVAKDRSGRTLAVEIKLVRAHGGRMPNGDIQRFLGQVALAATKHDAVIGLCGYGGHLRDEWREDTNCVEEWFEDRKAVIIFRPVT